MSNGISYDASEAPRTGFKAIRKVEGLLGSQTRKSREAAEGMTGTPKDQIETVLADSVILEMFDKQPAPDLKEGKFTFWTTYALPGEFPTKNSFWYKGVCESLKNLAKVRGIEITKGADGKVQIGGIIDKLMNTRVTVEQVEVELYVEHVKGTTEKIPHTYMGFIFCSDAGSQPAEITETIRKIIIGLKPPQAKRAVMLDTRANKDPSWKLAFDDNSICEKVGVKLNAAGEYEVA